MGNLYDKVASWRIIDANLNRGREALRAIEEYLRFHGNNAVASLRLKELRHDYSKFEASIPNKRRLNARNTPGDVGTSVSTTGETRRESSQAVAQAAFKRCGEALRAIEEYGKLLRDDIAPHAEALRYRVYALESRVFATASSRIAKAGPVMALIGAAECRTGYEQTLKAAYMGGVRLFQLREKNGNDRERMATLRRGMQTLRDCGDNVLILVNDRCDFAGVLGADGVHLGQDDIDVASARALLGTERFIGLSTHDVGELDAAEQLDVNYLGAGAMYPTETKDVIHKGGPAWGAKATRATELPVFAIGGVTLAHCEELAHLGVRRIAVSSAICQSDDPEAAAAELIAAMSNDPQNANTALLTANHKSGDTDV